MVSLLDFLRSKLLKYTMRFSFFRSLLLGRAYRLKMLALIALFLYFFASLFLPLWVLLVGPILWGVPHLIASLRYASAINLNLSQKKKLFYFQGFIWLCVFSYRLAVDIGGLQLFLSQTPLLFESICLSLTFLFQLYLFRQLTLRIFIYTMLFAGLLYSTAYFPMQTALFLLIGHNYVPLYAWYKSCQDNDDLRTFIFVSAVYIMLSMIILFGWADAFYHLIPAQKSIAFLNWDYTEIINSYNLNANWFRVVSLYAFSQGIHYFLWLKAIPENHLPKQYPPSFKWSLHRLTSEFGSGSIYFMLSLILIGASYWFFFEFQTSRVIYFSVAAYHGFMEIAALPFLKSNRSVHESIR